MPASKSDIRFPVDFVEPVSKTSSCDRKFEKRIHLLVEILQQKAKYKLES